jgi:hypothetical protein
MKKEDRKEFVRAMSKTAEAYGETLSEARIMIYFEDLLDLNLPDIVRALGMARKQLKFFPRVAQIREFIFQQVESEFMGSKSDKPLLENFMTFEERKLRREQEREAAKRAISNIYKILDEKQVSWKREIEQREMTEEEKKIVQERKDFLKSQFKQIQEMEKG